MTFDDAAMSAPVAGRPLEGTSDRLHGAAATAPPPHPSPLPPRFIELVARDEAVREAWRAPERGRDGSWPELDFSLARQLAPHLDDDEIAAVLRAYPFGEIGSGKLTGSNADRRLAKLLDAAAKHRHRLARRPETSLWWGNLEFRNGEPRNNLTNVKTVLELDPAFDGRFRFDELSDAVTARDLPWDRRKEWREWTDTDDIELTEWLQRQNVNVTRGSVADAVQLVARRHRHHAVRELLDGLAWDGTPRIDRWLMDYAGVAATPYSRAVGRAWLISGVARAYHPGCKVDHILILEGRQGCGKSSAARALALDDKFFADEVSDLGTKDSAQDLRGKWIIELAELSAMRRGELERVKAFLSRPVDHYRASYGRRSHDHPRHCVFVGTTNSDTYLNDETGARRFWPVKVDEIRLEELRRDAPQLWAEATVAFKAGEPWHLDRETEALAAAEQAERREEDPWEEAILAFIEGRRNGVRITDILIHLQLELKHHDQSRQKRVARVLRANGWERAKIRCDGKLRWAFVHPLPAAVSGDGDATHS